MDAKLCPPKVRESLERYWTDGVPVGDFLQAVLCNDLVGAFMRADEDNRKALGDIVAWVHGTLPCDIWGSREAYLSHIKSKYNVRVVDQVIDAIQTNFKPV